MPYGGNVGHIDHAHQVNWSIDPAGTYGGDDHNPGTAERPLRTLAEWKRRVGAIWEPGPGGIVTIMSDCAESLALVIAGRPIVSNGTIRGRRTVVASGTVAGATAQVGSTKAFATLTSTGQDWTPYINKRVYIAGTDDAWLPGNFAYILADAGSGVAVVTPWVNAAGDNNTPPSVGATWHVYNTPQISGQWGIHSVAAGHYVAVDLDVGGAAGFAGIYISGGYGAQCHAVRVLSDGYTLEAQQGANAEFWGCLALDGGHIRGQGAHLICWGGGARGTASRLYAIGGYLEVAAPLTLCDGAFLDVQGNAAMLVNAEIGIRTSSNRAVAVTLGEVQLAQLVFGTGITATNGIEVEAGQRLVCASGKAPSLDTPTNYASIGGTTRSAAQLASSYINTTNDAAFVYKAF